MRRDQEGEDVRYPIWKEDDYFHFVDGPRIDMDPSVVELPEESPLVWQYRMEKPPVGVVTDIRLEGEEITGEVEFFDTAEGAMVKDEMDKTLRLGGYYSDVKKKIITPGKQEVVTKCTLRCVSVMLLTLTPGWPR